MQQWVQDELATCDLGDARLDRRLGKLLDRLGSKPSLSIPAACRGRAEMEAAYRFFDNPRVAPAKILQPHRAATQVRMQGEPVVLIAQDTTEIDLTRRRERVGGPLDEGSRWGLFAHVQLAMTPDAVPLGVVACELWARDPAEAGTSQAAKRQRRKAKPIAAKESARWLEGYRNACAVAEAVPGARVVSLADSESDIYECLAEPGAADWVVRSCQDRALVDGGFLREKLLAAPPFGSWAVAVSRREKTTGGGRRREQPREARETCVEARAARVRLRPPSRPGGVKLPEVAVNAVLALEVQPPPGEEPIEWLLLTSLPVDTDADVRRVIDHYRIRWGSEVFFRTLKSGCGIEQLQLETPERMMTCVTVYLVVAWRVLYLRMRGRMAPETPCDAVFDDAEWKSAHQFVQGAVAGATPTLGDMVKCVASLGGYLGRSRDGPPGPKTFWVGLQRVRDLAAGYELATAAAKT